MKRAHFICRRLDNAGQDGLDLIGHLGEKQNVYRSDAWAIRPAEAEALVGGLVFFHDHRNKPSTFGGKVEWWCYSRQTSDRPGVKWRVILFIRAMPECIDAEWEGTGAGEVGWGGE
jgi:hypothetical protein